MRERNKNKITWDTMNWENEKLIDEIETMDWENTNDIYKMKNKFANDIHYFDIRRNVINFIMFLTIPYSFNSSLHYINKKIKYFNFIKKLYCGHRYKELYLTDLLLDNKYLNLYIKIIEKDIFDKTTSEKKYDKLLLYSANGNIKELKTLLKKYPKEPKKNKINDDILPFQWFECEKKN